MHRVPKGTGLAFPAHVVPVRVSAAVQRSNEAAGITFAAPSISDVVRNNSKDLLNPNYRSQALEESRTCQRSWLKACEGSLMPLSKSAISLSTIQI